MCGDAPSGPGGLVDGVADQRVAKPEASRGIRRAQQVRSQEAIECLERLRLGEAGGDRGLVDLEERLARHRPARQEVAATPSERGELSLDRCQHRRRHVGLLAGAERSRGRTLVGVRARQLLEEERIAAALSSHCLPRLWRVDRAEQEIGFGIGQRPQLKLRATACRGPRLRSPLKAPGRAERGDRPRPRALPRAVGAGDTRRVRQSRHRPNGGRRTTRTNPRRSARRPSNGPQCAMRPVALGVDSRRAGPARRGQRDGDVVLDAVDEPRQLGRGQRTEVVVDRRDRDRVRDAGLELGAASGEDERARGSRALAELAQQPALAEPGRSCNREKRAAARAAQPFEREVDRTEFEVASDQGHGRV